MSKANNESVVIRADELLKWCLLHFNTKRLAYVCRHINMLFIFEYKADRILVKKHIM